jgi:hypothetical protein
MSSENVVTLAAAGLAFVASLISIAVSAYNARLERFAANGGGTQA